MSLQVIVVDLYAQADEAITKENYNDASLLQAQADKLYQAMEDLGVIITEQEG